MINQTNFPSLNFNPAPKYFNNECLTAKMNVTSKTLDLHTSDCVKEQLIFCRKVLFSKPNCSEKPSFTNKSAFSILMNPHLKRKYQQAIAYQKAEMMDMLKRLDMVKAYQWIIRALWYSFIPCFDVRNITADMYEMSMLRYCEWRGEPISCSAIFTTFPTDKGLCCSFNMKAADEIYVESTFRETLQAMQSSDKINSFIPSTPPINYTQSDQPQTVSGVKNGLRVILDARSNWLVPGSFDADFHTFTAVIQPSRSFPLMSQGGLSIRPGYNNIITLISSKKNADENLRSIFKKKRNCLFPDENSDLKIHKQYSYFNCKFECNLRYAKKEVFNKYGKKCQPWFFPTSNDSNTICDPWISKYFFQKMSKDAPDSLCLHCLPDCSSTFYEPTINVVPFGECDANNLVVSWFCQVSISPTFNLLAAFCTKGPFK